MAYQLTDRAKNAISRELVEPNLVLKIDGIDKYYAIRISKKILRYDIPGLTYDMDGLFYDGLIDDENTEDLIAITGTTDTISAQLEPDKGAASSTQTLTIKLLDRNEEITQLISPGVVLPDLMYQNCKVYFGLYDTAFPEDYIEIFNGNVMGINPTAGTIDLVITHPDDLKRASIFEKVEPKLTAICNFSSATIQDLFIQKRPDVVGDVTINYFTNPIGTTANVNVLGNDISVEIDISVTSAKILKKKLENHEEANQLITVAISGDPLNPQTAQALTTLGSDDFVELDDVNGFFNEVPPLFQTYVKVGSEIIRYTGIDTVNNKLTGCTRQALTSFGETHSIGDNASSFYKYGDATSDNGNAVDLSLILLLSKGPAIFYSGIVDNIVNVPGEGAVVNSVFLPGLYPKRDHGASIGDFVSLSGSILGNNFTDKQISFIGSNEFGTWLVIDGVSLVLELDASCSIDFKSQYNLLPDGGGLLPSQVDVEQFRLLKARFPTAIAEYELYLKDTVSIKDLINTRILLPSAMYSIPRKGKISVGLTAPPLYDINSKFLKIDNVKDPKGLKIERSVNKNFYNAIAFKYNNDSVEDIPLNKLVTVSADSSNRIDAPARAFVINADGLRPSSDNTDLLIRNSNRFLDRYKFGAEFLKLKVLFKVGFGVEVGDSILFGDSNFALSDTTKGSKDFSPRVMEVTNKEWNWKTGNITLSLLDTTYSNDFRFGVFSPSSLVGTLSTTSEVIIKISFGTISPAIEKEKWSNYIGKEIVVHSEDWSVIGSSYLESFDPGNDNKMILNPPLAFTPLEDYIVDIVSYDQVDPLEGFYKNAHCFFTPQIDIVSGASSTSFDVSGPDALKFFEGSAIRVHNYDYSVDSGEGLKRVLSIVGTTITCDNLGFTPDNSMQVDLIGFISDEGKPYTWL